jgi:hypothetical protein
MPQKGINSSPGVNKVIRVIKVYLFIVKRRGHPKRDLLERWKLHHFGRWDISPFAKDGVAKILKAGQLHCPMVAVKDKDVSIRHAHNLLPAHNGNGLLRETLRPLFSLVAGLGLSEA